MAEIEELYVGLEYRWIIRDDFSGHLYNNNTFTQTELIICNKLKYQNTVIKL